MNYCTAADLIDTLYRGLADNSVGKIIDGLIRNDLIMIDEVGFAPLDDTGTQLLFRLVAAAYERRSLAIASHWPFEQWGRFLPEHTTAVSILDRLLHHATIVVTTGESYRMRGNRNHRRRPGNTLKTATGGDFYLAKNGDLNLAIDIPAWSFLRGATPRGSAMRLRCRRRPCGDAVRFGVATVGVALISCLTATPVIFFIRPRWSCRPPVPA